MYRLEEASFTQTKAGSSGNVRGTAIGPESSGQIGGGEYFLASYGIVGIDGLYLRIKVVRNIAADWNCSSPFIRTGTETLIDIWIRLQCSERAFFFERGKLHGKRPRHSAEWSDPCDCGENDIYRAHKCISILLK